MAVMGAEAEAAHFRWARQHFQDNGFNPAKHQLIRSVVGPLDGVAHFYTGSANQWYGQAIAPDYAKPTSFLTTMKRRFLRHKARPMDTVSKVPMVSLMRIL